MLSSRDKLLLDSISPFYYKTNRIEKLIPIFNGTSKISLRILDWFVTNYTKEKNIILLNNKKVNNIYLNYKSQLKAYSKKQFDPFCRRERISFFYDKENELVTTVGQLNFFRWAVENRVLDYISENLEDIEQDMNQSVRNIYNKRNKSKKNRKTSLGNECGSKKQRRRRQELSVNATKSVSKHNVKILVKFE